MRLIDVTHENCVDADNKYTEEKIAYAVAVKRCLQTQISELEALA